MGTFRSCCASWWGKPHEERCHTRHQSRDVYVMMDGSLQRTVCGPRFALQFELGSRAWAALVGIASEVE